MSNWVDVTAASNNNSIFNKTQTQEEKSILGKDDFLKILTTQLAHQDPSNPLQDKDFIAQMATFSSLEQMTNLNKAFENFANRQITQYSVSIGKDVTYTPTGGTTPVTGTVTGVSYQDGSYYFLVGKDKVSVDDVTEIKQSQTESK
ncbi:MULTISPECIES: flagellar hook assembly protein FlgD [Bacillaceae]|uniref:flagellar hook assembly protein FlgD n=1 Tax=Bacillaceae TaxID=186817 RepID=UPI002FFF2716